MSDWENRPVYEKITPEIMTAIPDDQLAWTMFDHIWFKVGKDYDAMRTGMHWTRSLTCY